MWDISRCIFFFFFTALERDWWRKMKTTTYQQLLRRVNWSFSSTFKTNSSNIPSPSRRSAARHVCKSVAHLGAFSAASCDSNAPPSYPLSLVFFPAVILNSGHSQLSARRAAVKPSGHHFHSGARFEFLISIIGLALIERLELMSRIIRIST